MSILIFALFAFAVMGIKWQLERSAAKQGFALSTAHQMASPRLIGMPPEERARVLKELKRHDQGKNDLHFHPGHAWARIDEEGAVEIGPDEITVKLLGNIETIDGIGEVGDEIKQGHLGWTLKRGKRFIKQVSPISGVISEINERVLDCPSGLNESPYAKGWLLKIIPSDLTEELKKLFAEPLAEEWLSLSRRRINSLFAPPGALATAQDGGELLKDIGTLLNEEQWNRISKELFDRESA